VARRPFDPSLARGGLFDAPGESAPLSVSQASERILRAVEGIGRVRVVGEVSNFSSPRHWYFTLKDDESQIGCVMWASRTSSVGFVPATGMEVIVTGTITHYGKGGRTQIDVQSMERRGEGLLQARYEALRRELDEKGWFRAERRRLLPAFPRRVAVITSFQADALQDVLKTARIRAPFVDILVVGVPVQGEAAAPAVAQAIAAVDRRADELGIDAMIVTRGGGSIEDLWAFNERIVAEAVFNAKTPVISAIGHESDVTIIDFVADHRASTPTQAVMELFPDRHAEGEQVDSLSGRMNRSARRRVEDARRHLSMLARHPLFRSPRAPIDLRRADLGRLAVRLASGTRATHSAARHRLADACARFERHRPSIRQAAARERLHSFDARLHAAARRTLADLRGQVSAADRQLRLLGPGETLARGWSLTFAADGSLLRSAADAGVGQELRTQFADGSVRSRVEPAADTPSSTLFGPHGG